MHYLDPPFSVDNTASDAPLIVFAIKGPWKIISILEKNREKHIVRWSCSNFTLTFSLEVALGMVLT